MGAYVSAAAATRIAAVATADCEVGRATETGTYWQVRYCMARALGLLLALPLMQLQLGY